MSTEAVMREAAAEFEEAIGPYSVKGRRILQGMGREAYLALADIVAALWKIRREDDFASFVGETEYRIEQVKRELVSLVTEEGPIRHDALPSLLGVPRRPAVEQMIERRERERKDRATAKGEA